jgi:ubiquinone/menaquinone biosynthesis C-methylase UbiE
MSSPSDSSSNPKEVTWDYSSLADAYLKRPDYASSAIDQMLSIAGAKSGDAICDVGAGVGHLTKELAKRGFTVNAVEPNDAMRNNGIKQLQSSSNVTWFKGTGENTGQASSSFDGVTFGSSLNVTDRNKALAETARILKPKGWFACMWNHRDLDDPIQNKIETIIGSHIAGYSYGTRREDQTDIINSSGLFGEVKKVTGTISWEQSIVDCVEAWRSHATLHRQAGDKFFNIINDIEKYLSTLNSQSIMIPYTTHIWVAKKLN